MSLTEREGNSETEGPKPTEIEVFSCNVIMLPMQILFAFESEFVVKEKSPISGYCSES